jgi:lipoprotein-releasing system permease protein
VRVQHFEPFKVSIAEEYPILRNDTAENLMRTNKDVKYVQAFATKSAILRSTETIEGILFKGVEKDYHFDGVEPFRVKGKWPVIGDSSGYSTEIMISHRLSTLLNANAILVMQPGRLVDSGRHEELLTRCETYQQLWNQQTSHL